MFQALDKVFNITIKPFKKVNRNLLKIPTGEKLTSMGESNLEPSNSNLSSDREEDLNLGPPDQKSSTLNHEATLPPQIEGNLFPSVF